MLAMMLLTAYSQFFIIPQMDTARDSIGGNVAAVAADNPGRQIFDRLHQRSVHVEGLVLLCGIAALFVTAHCSAPGNPSKPLPVAISLLAIYLTFAPQGPTQQKSMARKRRLPGRRVP